MLRKALAIVSMALVATLAAAQPREEGVQATLGTDRFVAGGTVRHAQAVSGDLIAAAGEVELSAPVQGDVVAFGGTLRLGGDLRQDLYAAGGRVTLDGAVAQNVRVAGGQVEIGPAARLAGNLTVAGGNVALRGSVKGYVQAAGGQVFVDGPVAGDVIANAGSVELGPNARIGGRLRYRSGEEMKRHPAAEVAGGIERLGPAGGAIGVEPGARDPAHRGGGWIWAAGLVVLAAFIAGALPAVASRVSGELRARPWVALLLGFVALVCIPAAALLLMITVLGIPLALVVLLLYFALLIVGYASAAVAVSDWALARFRSEAALRTAWRVGAAMLAMLAIAIVARVPFVGPLVVLAAMLFGMGAMLLAMRPPRAMPAL